MYYFEICFFFRFHSFKLVETGMCQGKKNLPLPIQAMWIEEIISLSENEIDTHFAHCSR